MKKQLAIFGLLLVVLISPVMATYYSGDIIQIYKNDTCQGNKLLVELINSTYEVQLDELVFPTCENYGHGKWLCSNANCEVNVTTNPTIENNYTFKVSDVNYQQDKKVISNGGSSGGGSTGGVYVGTSTSEEEEEQVVTEVPEEEIEAEEITPEENVTQEPQEQPEKQQIESWKILLVLLVVVLIIVGIFGYHYYIKEANKKEEQKEGEKDEK